MTSPSARHYFISVVTCKTSSVQLEEELAYSCLTLLHKLVVVLHVARYRNFVVVFFFSSPHLKPFLLSWLYSEAQARKKQLPCASSSLCS